MKPAIYSRENMEQMLRAHTLPSGALVISFYDQGDLPVDFTGYDGRWITIGCEDVEADELEDYDLTEETFMPEAAAVAQAILEALGRKQEIICQCEHGQSRSAAVSAAILQFTEGTGMDIFMDDRYYPNKLVCRKVYRALAEAAKESPL